MNLPPIKLDASKAMERPSSKTGARFGDHSRHQFFTTKSQSMFQPNGRNHPQSQRVRFISGVGNSRICVVDGSMYGRAHSAMRYKQLPTGQAIGQSSDFIDSCLDWLHKSPIDLRLKSIQNASGPTTSNIQKLSAESWSKCLSDFSRDLFGLQQNNNTMNQQTNKAFYSSQTGRLIPAKMRTIGGGGVTMPAVLPPQNNNSSMNESLINIVTIQLLGQILQTKDVATIQHWLANATQIEKGLISSLLQVALEEHSNQLNSTTTVTEDKAETTTDNNRQIETIEEEEHDGDDKDGEEIVKEAVKTTLPQIIRSVQSPQPTKRLSRASHTASAISHSAPNAPVIAGNNKMPPPVFRSSNYPAVASAQQRVNSARPVNLRYTNDFKKLASAPPLAAASVVGAEGDDKNQICKVWLPHKSAVY